MSRSHGTLGLSILVLGGLLRATAWGADGPNVETKGTIEAVTVYRGQALVTRVVSVPGPAGLREVVVGELPEQILPGSIYAETAEALDVRSVSYRVRPVLQDVRESVRKLDEQIRSVNDKVTANARQKTLLEERRAYLDKLSTFIAPTAQTELSKGVLNADTLQALTRFQFDQRDEMVKSELTLGIEARELKEQLEHLEREREQVAGASSKLAREAIVFVNLTGNGGKLRLRYLVSQASWSPSYNVRTDKDRKGVTIEYLASIQQMSGEDWEKVDLTLSTATPSLVAMAPRLGELSIVMVRSAGGQQGQPVPQDYAAAQRELKQQLEASNQGRLILSNSTAQGASIAGVNTYNGGTIANAGTLTINSGSTVGSGTVTINGTLTLPANGLTIAANNAGANFNTMNDPLGNRGGLDNDVNVAAGNLQALDLMTRDNIVRKPRGKSGGSAGYDEGLSVNYRIPNATSLPSRSDTQLIQITAQPLKAVFYKVASPVLSAYVYDEALVTNDGANVLLAGPVSTYADGQFVGQGAVPSVTIGETFTIGLGIDSSLRAKRELVEKIETTQGGNRVVDFTYRLSIENFGDRATLVRLLDRLPTAKESEVRITLQPLEKEGRELSADADYLQNDRKRGILRWDFETPPHAVGNKATALEYSFRMEYDRQLSIGTPAVK